jgi:hypothetical protein
VAFSFFLIFSEVPDFVNNDLSEETVRLLWKRLIPQTDGKGRPDDDTLRGTGVFISPRDWPLAAAV